MSLDEKLETLLNIVYPQPFRDPMIPPPNFMADDTPLTVACQGAATAILCLFPELTEKVVSPKALSDMVDEMIIARVEQNEEKLRERYKGSKSIVLDKLDAARARLGRVPPIEVEREVPVFEDPAIEVDAVSVQDEAAIVETSLILKTQGNQL